MPNVVKEELIRIRSEGGEQVAAEYAKVSQAHDTYNASVERSSSAQVRAAGTSRQMNMAMIDVGRVVQDLPYGFRGIANNIDPLLLSMRRLQEQAVLTGVPLTGLMGKAAAFASVLNPLMVSAIGAAILIGPSLISMLSDSSKAAEDNAGKMKDLNKEWHDFLLQTGRIESGSKVGIIEGDIETNKARMEALKNQINALEASKKGAAEEAVLRSGGMMNLEEVKKRAVAKVQAEINKLGDDYNRIFLANQKLEDDILELKKKQTQEEEKLLKTHETYLRKKEQMEKGLRATFSQKTAAPPGMFSGGKPFDEEAPDAELKRLEIREKALQNTVTYLRLTHAAESDILAIEKERKEVQDQIDKAIGKVSKKEDDSLKAWHSMVSAANSLRSGLEALGVHTDSWLGKLTSVLQVVVSIKEAIEAIKLISSIFSFTSVGPAAVVPAAGGGPPVKGGGDITPQMRKQAARLMDEVQRLGVT